MELLVLILLIVLNAFFAASEIALISLNDNKVKAMAESGDKKAKLLQNLLSEPSRFLATIQIGITLAGFLASAFAAESYAGTLAGLLYEAGFPLPQEVLETISVVLITLILSYFTLVLGELVPKRLAMQKAEPISRMVVTPLTVLSKLAAPFVKLLTLSTNLFVRMFGVDPNDNKEQVTEEEIRMMVDVGNENGTIQEAEKIMINNIFDFDNITVSELMTHRSRVVGIPISLSVAEAAAIVQREKFSRYPVYEDNMDQIVGILHVKDLIPSLSTGAGQQIELKDIILQPYFTPTSKRADELFSDMKKNKVHMAIVIDEYGGTAGIVTIEDLLEEIVGNILDEHDEEEKEIEKLDESTYLINGMISLRSLQDVLKVDLPVEEYDTLSGFLIGQLGRIPEPGDLPEIEFAGYLFKVHELDERRILKAKVCRAS